MLTIAEMPEYTRRAESLLGPAERSAIIDFLAERPKSGDLIEGTGGIRKLRWSCGARGKSGGVRVIYYFHSESMPLSAHDIFQERTLESDQGGA